MKLIRNTRVIFSRFVGRLVCKVRGHRYYYGGSVIMTNSAYHCIRCGALDQPFEDLEPLSNDDLEYLNSIDDESDNFHDERERRIFAWLPFLKWL